MSDESVFDMGTPTTDNTFAEHLLEKCEQAIEIQEQIERAESALDAMRSRLHELRSNEIPEAVAAAGFGKNFELDTGHNVKIEQKISGSIPSRDEEKRKNALNIVRQYGGGDLIKNTLTVEFPKGSDEEAKRIFGRLEELGFEPALKMAIHPSTLRSWVREKLLHGEDVPTDTIGIHVIPVAKITPPKDEVNG